jgi:protein-serine/threonine kinase
VRKNLTKLQLIGQQTTDNALSADQFAKNDAELKQFIEENAKSYGMQVPGQINEQIESR